VFYLDVACARAFSSGFVCFLQAFQTYILSVSSVFGRMLQMFHSDVSKVDKVLHLPLAFYYLVSVSPPPPDAGQASAAPSPSFSTLVTFGAA
jgi:hypothetical protein